MASSSSSSSPEISHAPSALDASFFSRASLDEVLEELSTRFIMNLPDQELASIERISFQVEQAHWYYEDFIREANPKLPSMQLRRFSLVFFNSCPLLRKWASAHEEIFDSFMSYKVTVPVCGAILINENWDKVLLVKGWKSSAGWGFPKGKINQGEPARACAAREVEEEIGFQISNLINEQYIAEQNIRGQRVTLFMVPNVPEDYAFQTHTRKEISKIEWFKVADLPGWKKKQVVGKFYLVAPFMNTLKEFMTVNKPAQLRTVKRTRTKRNGQDNASQRRDDCDKLPMAVNMDRDTNGYSSSSAENGEPYTPSPQSAEAIPVSTSADEEESSLQAIDPHFARLLSGLTLSASKPSLNGHTDQRPISVTPTSASNVVTASNPNVSRTTIEERARLAATSSPLVSTVLNLKSPTESISSAKTVGDAKPSNVDCLTPAAQPSSAATSDSRFLKQLALLESVAQESAAKTPVPSQPFNLQTHPGPPSSVPPHHLFGSEAHGSFISNSSASSRPPAPPFSVLPFNGSNSMRPMTSLSFTQPPPPPPSNMRHSSNLSMQQGALLSILGSPRGLAPQMNTSLPPVSPTIAQPIGGHIPPGYLSPRTFGLPNLQPIPMLRQQPFAHPSQGYPGGSQQLPLTGPLLNHPFANLPVPPIPQPQPQSQMQVPLPSHSQLPMGVGIGVNALPSQAAAGMHPAAMRAPAANASHLLSLLNNNNIARSATTLFSGSMRPNSNQPASF